MISLSEEQLLAANYASDMVVNAGAGTGKTTLCSQMAKMHPNTTYIYLTFNRRNMKDAKEKFADMGLDNINAYTFHSLAMDYVKSTGKSINLKKGDWKSYELVKELDIKRKANMPNASIPFKIAEHSFKLFSYFCNSSLSKIQDVEYSKCLNDSKAIEFYKEYRDEIKDYSVKIISSMYSEEMEVNFDFLLKFYQLAKVQIVADYIILDETQDASDAMLSILSIQEGKKVAVGDHHQSIYSWRYAINSMKKIPFQTFNLTGSYRFGEEIALVANAVLKWKVVCGYPTEFILRGLNTNREYDHNDVAFLARKNSGLFKAAILALNDYPKSIPFNFEGGLNSYLFSDVGISIYDVYNIGTKNTERVKNPLAKSCSNLEELKSLAKELNDNGLKTYCDLYSLYSYNLLGFIEEFKKREVKDPENQVCLTFSTVHKAKGREYNIVELCDDFLSLEQLLAEIKKPYSNTNIEEEINILYVAVTRARYKVFLPKELNPFMYEKYL